MVSLNSFNKKQRNGGFTLVEMLIAMVILSSVTLIGASAFSMFSRGWDGRLGNFDKNFQQVKTQLLAQDILSSIVPYVAFSADGKKRLYFEGNRNGFVAVSLRSMQDPTVPAVIRLSVQQNDDLSFRLIYEEWPMQSRLLLKSGVPLAFDAPIIIKQRLQDISFRYFGEPPVVGVTSISEADEAATNARAQWYGAYNSLATFRQPSKIEITWLEDADSSPYVQTVDLVAPSPGQATMTSEDES